MDYQDDKPAYMDVRDYKSQQIQDFLKKIAMLESSGGRNTNHKEVESGPQSGETAIGAYGLMPHTIEELAKRYPSDNTKGLSKEQLVIGNIVDPNMANTTAGTLADYLKNKRGLSDEQAAVAWEQGHNLSEERINLKSDRARKFRVLKNGK